LLYVRIFVVPDTSCCFPAAASFFALTGNALVFLDAGPPSGDETVL
jgi:hypothetical protein